MASEIQEKVQNFFDAHPPRKYSKGQILLLPGDELQYVYYLMNGTVKMYDVSYRGEEIILTLFKPPAFFPMSLAINGRDNTYIYEAETDIIIRQAPAQDVVDFVKTNPEVLYDLMSRVYRGVDGLLGRIGQLMTGSAKSRLIYELLLEAKRFGVTRKDGSCVLPLHEKDFGARAGLSRETVSREVSKLKSAGLLSTTGKGIVLEDIEKLESTLVQAL